MKITKSTSRTGEAIWIVSWGPGLTQTAICLSEAEAKGFSLVNGKVVRPNRREEPLVGFRSMGVQCRSGLCNHVNLSKLDRAIASDWAWE